MKIKRFLAVCLVAIMMISALAIQASAATTSGTLYSTESSKTISLSSKYSEGSGYLSTYSDSNDGVNYYLDYSTNKSSWTNAKHIFAEPGATASTGKSYPGSRYWRGVMNSWWPGGTGCHAYGSLTANN